MSEEMTIKEAGKRGGNTTKARYGREHYQKIGKIGGQKTAQVYGTEFYQEIGKSGGDERAKKLSQEELAAIGQKGGLAEHPNGRGLQNTDSKRVKEIARLGGLVEKGTAGGSQ